jgi:hypothetical protein
MMHVDDIVMGGVDYELDRVLGLSQKKHRGGGWCDAHQGEPQVHRWSGVSIGKYSTSSHTM